MEKYKDRIRRLLDKGYGIFIGLIIANPPTIDEPGVGRSYVLWMYILIQKINVVGTLTWLLRFCLRLL